MTDAEYRLFACWCVRHTHLPDGRTLWDLLDDQRSRDAVITAEQYAVGAATQRKLRTARNGAWSAFDDACGSLISRQACMFAVNTTASIALNGVWDFVASTDLLAEYDVAPAVARAAQASQLRAMIGDPSEIMRKAEAMAANYGETCAQKS